MIDHVLITLATAIVLVSCFKVKNGGFIPRLQHSGKLLPHENQRLVLVFIKTTLICVWISITVCF